MRKPRRGVSALVMALALLILVPLSSGRVEAGCYYCDIGDDSCFHCMNLNLPGPEGQANCVAGCNFCNPWGSYCSWV